MSTRGIVAIICALLVLATSVWLVARVSEPENVSAVSRSAPNETAAVPSAQPQLISAQERETSRVSVVDPVPQSPAQVPAAAQLLKVLVIRKDHGAPVPHCKLAIQESGPRDRAPGSAPPFVAAAETNAEGGAEFHVPPAVSLYLDVGTWVAGGDESSRNSFGKQSVVVEAFALAESRELIIELPFGHDLSFWGKLVSSVDGTAVVGAHVSWSEAVSSTPSATSLAPAPSDAEGYFEMSVPSWDPGLARIRADGFGPALVLLVSGHEVRERALELHLTLSASIEVQVNDHTAGATQPITVEMYTPSSELLLPDGGYTNGEKRWRATCDGAGRCVLAGLPSRALLGVVLKRGRTVVMPIAKPLILEPGEQRRVEWTIGSGATLSGRIVDQHGAAVVQRKMWLVQRDGSAGTRNSGPCYFYSGGDKDAFGTTTTDNEGRFAFHDVPAGVWWLGPAMTRRTRDPIDPNDVASVVTVIETPEGVNQSVVLSVDRGFFIRGKVVDPEGHPVPQVFVTAWGTSIQGPTSAHQSDNEGSFVIGPVAATPHLVRASDAAGYSEPEPVMATPNGSPIVLQLQAGGGISGRVVDPATGRGARAQVVVTHLASPGWMGTGTDEDGSFEMDGLAPGTYDIAARTDDARVGIERGVVVVAGREPPSVQLRLEPGARVTICYQGSANHVGAFVFSETTVVDGDGIRTGTQRTFVAPAGHVRIEVNGGGDLKETREIDLVAGETRELSFKFP